MPLPWILDPAAFAGLLAALHPDRDQAALRYEELHERLVRIFIWERAIDPETLADEALTRLARRLAEGEPIQNIPAFLNGIARNLLKEEANRRHLRQPLPDLPAPPPNPNVERHHLALEHCMAGWEPDKRELLLAYYQGDHAARIRNRQELAARLGIDLNALRNRALRLRERLEICIRKQLDRDTPPPPDTQNGKGLQ